MLRSLYSGVSGLRNHQVKMDVLGNNIANINTTAFKGGRVHFSETVNQMISGGQFGSGGFLNPMQVGLGMKASSIDTMFQQGALESTGNLTDMAIEGEGFFVVKNGDAQMYTRAGAFYFNSEGRLVNQSGFAVQGWTLAGTGSTSGTSNSLSDIVLDTNLVSEAESTENIWLNGNLNAGLRPETEVWTMGTGFTTKALLNGGAVAFPVNVVAGTNDEFVLDVDNGSAVTSETLTMNAGSYADISALVAELNTQISANSNLTGRVEAVVDGTSVKFRSLDGNASTSLTLHSGTNDVLTDLGFTDGDSAEAGQPAALSTDMNDLLQVNTDFALGDTIQISGANPDGTTVDATYTYNTGTTTVQDLVDSIGGAFSGVNVTMNEGQIVLTDTTPGDSDTRISLSAGTTNTGTVNLPGFFNTTPGFTGKTSVSAIVYDSLGGSHNLVVEFTKTANDGEWTWQVISSGDEKIISGDSGRIRFNEAGVLSAFTYDNGAAGLSMDPGNGASLMNISLHPESTDEFSGLSQFESVSTLAVRDQDGRATGTLAGISISKEGLILGTFSNGENIEMAKIAMAQFSNNGGLIDLGDGVYQSNISSGEPVIFGADNNLPSSIISGALEMSNVDIAKEFTDMITAQRGFQANAKTISTADQIIDELLRLKR